METLRPLLKFPCLLGMPEFGAQRRDRQLWLHMGQRKRNALLAAALENSLADIS